MSFPLERMAPGQRIEVTRTTDLHAYNGGIRSHGYVKGERGVVVDPSMVPPLIRLDGCEQTMSIQWCDLRPLDIVDLVGEA